MTSQSVGAVIITYHPDVSMVDNLSLILAQVNGLVVVDNGSDPSELDLLRKARNSFGFHLIENATNLGIAEALNEGVRWAVQSGYPWIILFDQDSRITDGFIAKMFACLESHPERDRIGSLQPKYVDPETGIEAYVWRAKDGGPVKSMTSGALIPTWIFDKLGLFSSEYFIDDVDTEYCFRIRAAGYLIADSRLAVLQHSSGRPRKFTLIGFTFSPAHHNATRRYYMSRNRLVVCRKYFRVFPRWILQYMYECLKETIKCFIGERDRPRKLRSLLLGTWDGLTGRMGKREGI